MKKTSGLSELILTTCNVAKVTCDESDKEAEMKRLRQEIDQILKEDDRLKTCLLDLVQHQWPFSWIKGQQTFLDLINREIGQTISQEFKKAENKPCPTVRLTFGKKIHLSQGKIKKGSKWDLKATMGGIDKKVYSELSAIPFENPTTDVLQVIIDKDGTCFAVAFVPLRDVIQGQFQNWTAKDLEDRPVGHLEMQVDFNNVDHVSHKEMAQKILNENMLKLVSELYEQPFDEGKKVTKVQYGVLISEEKTKPGEAWLTRTSVTLFSDDVSVATEFLPDNGTQVFLPIQDLTSEKVEIRVHQRKTSPSSKKAEFLNKLKSLKNNNNYENVGYNYDWTQIRLSEICFKEGLKFKWRDDLIWHLRLAVKCPQSFQKMSLDELTAFQTLTELKREWVDSTPLLNYSRPFFSPLEWKTAELNAKLRLFNLKASQRQSFEEQILDRLLDLTKKHHEVPQLEVESLK